MYVTRGESKEPRSHGNTHVPRAPPFSGCRGVPLHGGACHVPKWTMGIAVSSKYDVSIYGIELHSEVLYIYNDKYISILIYIYIH